MVNNQIRARGINNQSLISAMLNVPREKFVRKDKFYEAYSDHPIPIGYGQTISQPYMVAIMTDKLDLNGRSKVLEIGTGSGYQTAILAEIAQTVYTIERIEKLYVKAGRILLDLGYRNIHCRLGDGSLGWPDEAPFDNIIVTAAVPEVPEALKLQLNDNGVLVVPVGNYKLFQTLMIVRRRGNRFEINESIGCRFVPLIGTAGY